MTSAQKTRAHSKLSLFPLSLFLKTLCCLLTLGIITSSLCSCSSSNSSKKRNTISPYDPEFDPDDDELYEEDQVLDVGQQLYLVQEALKLYDQELFSAAREALRSVQRQYPASYYAPLIELKIADANYFLAAYSEAIEAYEEFIRLRPHHEASPYAMLQIGNSFFAQYRGVVFDQAPLTHAEKRYEQTILSHPQSSITLQAEGMLERCQKLRQKHEGYVAQFYYKQGLKHASMNRTKKLLGDIQLQEAKYYLGPKLYKEMENDVSTEELASFEATRLSKQEKKTQEAFAAKQRSAALIKLQHSRQKMSGRGQDTTEESSKKTKPIFFSCLKLKNAILLEVVLPGELSEVQLVQSSDTLWNIPINLGSAKDSTKQNLTHSLTDLENEISCHTLGLELSLQNETSTTILRVNSEKKFTQPQFIVIDRPYRLIGLFPSSLPSSH